MKIPKNFKKHEKADNLWSVIKGQTELKKQSQLYFSTFHELR